MAYYSTLIRPAELQTLTNTPTVIIDCRFSLADTEEGRRFYHAGHIPDAHYAHLDEDLSGPIIPGQTGRHPLPSVEEASALFGRWGISQGVQVVVYDDKKGAIAARLWWMLRWLGHDQVAVLEGGWTAWVAAGGAVSTELPGLQPAVFQPQERKHWIVDAERVDQIRQDDNYHLIDSRAAERYRGEVEPIDPIAGHIPGAQNLPFPENWQADGTMKSADELQARFAGLPPDSTVFYCGSGVTACHNLLAYAHAGLGEARLYPGSWSDWITDEEREVGS
jgi:thiosulfate/3-mercaptopyruvate sulfurtransferase